MKFRRDEYSFQIRQKKGESKQNMSFFYITMPKAVQHKSMQQSKMQK